MSNRLESCNPCEITVPEEIVESARRSIEKFQMISPTAEFIPTAASGGKDSTCLIIALRQLGYKVLPVTIDRGDDILFKPEEITSSLQQLGFSCRVINLRSDNSMFPPESQETIAGYLYQLNHLDEGGIACTPCYNARTIALVSFAESIGAPVIALGMHRTDLLVSFLKFYWIERYYDEFTAKSGIPYNQEMMQKLMQEEDIDLKHLEEMVEQQRAATDDPPVEILSPSVKFIRPLVEVGERAIKAFVDSSDLTTNSANCRYRDAEKNVPFRLILQGDLHRRTLADPQLEEQLLILAMRGIKDDGTLKFRPRNYVHDYYPGFDPRIQSKL